MHSQVVLIPLQRIARTTWRVVAATLVGVLAMTLPPRGRADDAAGAKRDAEAGAAMERGFDWLKSVQASDGYWSASNFPAMTALGLWAFARSDRPDKAEVCAKAAAFVARCAQPDGGIYVPARGGRGSGGLSTYNTAICMTALHAYNAQRYAPIILAARRFMAASQLAGDMPGAGGFGYDQPPKKGADQPGPMERRGARADLSNTGWALQAMRVTQELEDLRAAGDGRVDVDWSAALKFLATLQNQDPADEESLGGFGYEATGERGGTATQPDGTVRILGFGSMTYAGLESMIYAQVDRTDPRVASALRWAARHWSVDENPGMGTKGLFYYYTIMGKSLSLTQSDVLVRPAGDPIPWKAQLVGKLIALQRPDGSWINSDGTYWESDATLVTTYALLALEYSIGR